VYLLAKVVVLGFLGLVVGVGWVVHDYFIDFVAEPEGGFEGQHGARGMAIQACLAASRVN
jgi:hypothetical protein